MKQMSEADTLLSKLTLNEKLSLLAGKSLFRTRGIPRLGLAPLKLLDGPRGVGWHSAIRKCTAFPTGIALGASWDPALAEEFGAAIGSEVKACGGHVALGPAVNICRTPLNGRTFEYPTEDPHLNARLAVPMVRGIQAQGVAACIKHFAVNNQETGRMKIIAQVSERALREIYLPAFEAAVREADVWSVMAAYNGVNGDPCCENETLLKTILRDEWGFEGFVVSDWWAAKRTSSAAACARAGLNLEMPGRGSRYRPNRLKQELASGALTEQMLDTALLPLLKIWLRLSSLKAEEGKRNTPGHQQLAHRMAAESITLLKNEPQILPLKPSVRKVAVIGPKANRRNCLPLYGGSAGVWSPYEITPLQGIKAALPAGCELVKHPAHADVALVFVGLGHRVGGDFEGKDRQHMRLPEKQEKLIEQTCAANPNTVVVLMSGSPLEMPWIDRVSAIVAAWYPGMEGGRAIADVLFGKVNPSGKLPVTFPRRLADAPAHQSERQFPGENSLVHYDEDIYVGYRHFDRNESGVLFPFGHGLSYTRFEYSGLKVPERWAAGDNLAVRVSLQNAGEMAGAEVVQLYLAAENASVERPVKELKAFKKQYLEAGEATVVEFILEEKALAFWCEASGGWRIEPGTYVVVLGSSSQDIRASARVTFG